MNDINIEALAAIVGAVSEKTWIDHIPAILAGFAPLLAIWMSWKFFNDQHKQNAKNKVVEKDVERLYGAADLFFEYSDALNLYLSMVITKAGFLDRGEKVPDSVEDKTLKATDDVYPKINSIYKSYFFLRSLGADDIAQQVDDYREKTIKFRKNLFDIAKYKEGSELPAYIKDKTLLAHIGQARVKFTNERDEILIKMAEYKKVLISTGLE